MKTENNVKAAIKRAGGVAVVAAHFNISPTSVYEWIHRECVPAEKCPEIEKLSNGAAVCEEMNGGVDWQYLRASGRKAKRKAASPAPH